MTHRPRPNTCSPSSLRPGGEVFFNTVKPLARRDVSGKRRLNAEGGDTLTHARSAGAGCPRSVSDPSDGLPASNVTVFPVTFLTQ